MLNAEKNALRQNAEQELLQIRDKELSYFVANFSSFATQSSLIGGFTLSALTAFNPDDYDVRIPFSVSILFDELQAFLSPSSFFPVCSSGFCLRKEFLPPQLHSLPDLLHVLHLDLHLHHCLGSWPGLARRGGQYGEGCGRDDQ